MTKTSKGKTIVPKEHIDESIYRHIQNLQTIYKFDSIEQTINVVMDFVLTDDQLIAFDGYVKKQFPSKFI